MAKILDKIFGRKVSNTRIVPVVLKIVVIFALIIMVSSLASNYINLMLNRTEQIKLMKQLLVKDLKQIYTFGNNQFEIYQFNQDLDSSRTNIQEFSLREFTNQKSIALGINPDGEFFFRAARFPSSETRISQEAFTTILDNRKQGVYEDSLTFVFGGDDYFGVYKYNSNWDIYLLRAEELNEFYYPSWMIFRNVSFIILGVTVASALVGIFLLQRTLRFVGLITAALLKMQEKQQLDIIDMATAPNDDISFLGVSFNALSGTINNLLTIFRKFVTRDVALKAYRDKFIRLEGNQRDLTILFSDIKSFTFITETLGSDIIKLLNMHYDRAIHSVLDNNGIIGSIIGDALLAVFGTMPGYEGNKCADAVKTAYQIQTAAASLRTEMMEKRQEIIAEHREFTDEEERLFKAVMLEVGVGIDGGDVFYGNIGSVERMTNTVIGDNVNASSRLEGLTRIYKVPVICSDFVKEEIEKNGSAGDLTFIEIDQVQVKGKTVAKRIYWPVLNELYDSAMEKELKSFSAGLQHYYSGRWAKARTSFKQCKFPLADAFKDRVSGTCPKDWNGVWTMTEK